MTTYGVHGQSGFTPHLAIPETVHRQRRARLQHSRRSCRDDRAYITIPWTIPSSFFNSETFDLDIDPMWRVDRDYWIARAAAVVGIHRDGDHPNDGAVDAGGGDIHLNLRRVDEDAGTDVAILTGDNRLVIREGNHKDAANANEDGILEKSDFNVRRLRAGQFVYPRIVYGSTAGKMAIDLVLVPYPQPDRDDDETV